MIDFLVRSFLGNWGGRILDFYLEYSLWINGLILLYFLIIVIGRWNYRLVLFSLSSYLFSNYESQLTGKNQNQISSVLRKIDIPWEQGIKASIFPLLTPPGGFRPYLKNEKSLQMLYSNETIADALSRISN